MGVDGAKDFLSSVNWSKNAVSVGLLDGATSWFKVAGRRWMPIAQGWSFWHTLRKANVYQWVSFSWNEGDDNDDLSKTPFRWADKTVRVGYRWKLGASCHLLGRWRNQDKTRWQHSKTQRGTGQHRRTIWLSPWVPGGCKPITTEASGGPWGLILLWLTKLLGSLKITQTYAETLCKKKLTYILQAFSYYVCDRDQTAVLIRGWILNSRGCPT